MEGRRMVGASNLFRRRLRAPEPTAGPSPAQSMNVPQYPPYPTLRDVREFELAELQLVLEPGAACRAGALVHGLGTVVIGRGQPAEHGRPELTGSVGAGADQGAGGPLAARLGRNEEVLHHGDPRGPQARPLPANRRKPDRDPVA